MRSLWSATACLAQLHADDDPVPSILTGQAWRRSRATAAIISATMIVPVLAEESTPTAARRAWDASIGGVIVRGPEFAGSDRYRLRLNPGFYVRWGRLSVATRGGFRTSSEPGERGGMRIDLSPSERFRINVGVRYDAGRQESSSDQLQGLGDIPSTLRVRTSGSYRIGEGWSAGATVIFDALGRGGGWQGDVHFGRELRFSADTTWSFGAGLGYAGDRHMQTYFGVTEEQSARTGYPVYTPPSGLRDLSMAVNARTQLGGSWHMFYGGSASRLLGPAAASPLTRRRNAWSLDTGLVYRF